MTRPTLSPTAPTAEEPLTSEDAPAADDELIEQDLLVEDVSIDGMCGVY
ncbi:mycofactocin precursor MftA [Streptomyces sp. NPDC054919]